MLSICLYVTEDVADEDGLTWTLIVDVSINELSKIYLWLNREVSTVNSCVTKLPSKISTLLNSATAYYGTLIYTLFELMRRIQELLLTTYNIWFITHSTKRTYSAL